MLFQFSKPFHDLRFYRSSFWNSILFWTTWLFSLLLLLLAHSFLFGRVWKMRLILQICGFESERADKMHVKEKKQEPKVSNNQTPPFLPFPFFPPFSSTFTSATHWIAYHWRIVQVSNALKGGNQRKGGKDKGKKLHHNHEFFLLFANIIIRQKTVPQHRLRFLGRFSPENPKPLFPNSSFGLSRGKGMGLPWLTKREARIFFGAFFMCRRYDERIGFHVHSNV